MRSEATGIAMTILMGIIVLAAIIFGWQWFKVFSATQTGKAELAQAEMNRQIKVREAEAARDAATLLAEAEIARAHGVAQANEIIANGLGGPEGYLRYLYIHMLEEQTEKQIIYVPTEAGLPILEAGRR